jgi:prevent-host-death family protein
MTTTLLPHPASTWQVQEAKNRFSDLLNRAAIEGPQTITRHGKPVAQVVALPFSEHKSSGMDAVPVTSPQKMSFGEYLLTAPRVGDLEIPVRHGSKAPPVLGE